MKEKIVLVLAFALVLATAFAQSAGYSKTPSLTVWKSESSPFPASAGSELFLKVVARNYGQENAADFTVEFESSYPFTLVSDAKKVQKFTEGLCGFCDRELDYHILVDDNVKTGTYPVKLKLSHTYGGSTTTFTREISVAVTGSKRVLGVFSTNADENDFGVGENEKLEITLRNYGKEQLNYIAASITPPSGIKVIGSNKRFITTAVNANQDVKLSFDIVIAGDATEGAYSIPLALELKDASGTETTLEESIGIAVRGEPEILVFAQGSDPLYLGTKGDLLVTFANVAPYDVKFLKVTIDSGDLRIISKRQEYIGHMDPDDLESADFEVFVPADAKDPEVRVALEYRDKYNKEYLSEKIIPVKVLEAPHGQEGGLGIGTILLVLVVIGAGYWYWRKKKKDA